MANPPARRLRPHSVLPGEARVAWVAHQSLTGDHRGLRAVWRFLGPAFIAAVAYMDPGNFATNFAGRAKYGYLLVWVIVAANLIAMLIQSMSAKLGIATAKNLAEVCRDRFPRLLTIALWLRAEVIATATDLAELVGAALGLHLLFGLPLFAAGALAGAVKFGILFLQQHGFRGLEAVIAGLVAAIVLAFALQVLLARPSAAGTARGLIPGFVGAGSVYLAIGIFGATVMPHVIYLHSALTQHRIEGKTDLQRWRIYRFGRIDVIIAMTIVGLINLSMLMIAAAVCYARGITGAEDLGVVYTRLGGFLGVHHRGFRDRAAGLGALLLHCRDDGGPDRHAGLHPPLDPVARAPVDHTCAFAGCARPRRDRVGRACVQPGHALVRRPVRARSAASFLPRPLAHVWIGKPADHLQSGGRRRHAHRLPQPVPPLPHIRLRMATRSRTPSGATSSGLRNIVASHRRDSEKLTVGLDSVRPSSSDGYSSRTPPRPSISRSCSGTFGCCRSESGRGQTEQIVSLAARVDMAQQTTRWYARSGHTVEPHRSTARRTQLARDRSRRAEPTPADREEKRCSPTSS